MSYTRGQWARDFLRAIGNSNPSPETVNWVAAWTNFETACCGGASYNLLNTTEPNTPGVVSNFNGVGVKNYNNYQNGITANAKVIRNGYYNTLASALQTNNASLLYSNNPSINQELGVWGTGGKQGAIASLAQNPNAFINQAFGGSPMTVATGTGSSLGQSPFNPNNPTTTQQNVAAGATATGAGGCAPWDIGCGIGVALNSFWTNFLLPFLEHMFLFMLAFILIVVGFILLGGNPIAAATNAVKRATV